MSSEILSAGLLGAGHAGSSGGMVMLAVIALIAVLAFGLIRWRQRRRP